jgi:hypothetical protein
MARMRAVIAFVLAFGLFASLGTQSSTASRQTGSWVPTGSMGTARLHFTATLLLNGDVLVAGGQNGAGTILASAELYNAATGTWSATGSMNAARFVHNAVLLPNGRVLVAGGSDGITGIASAEIYNPVTGKWRLTGSMSTPRVSLTASLVTIGGETLVLAAGGSPYCGGCDSLGSAELYNPATGTWSLTDSMKKDRNFEVSSPESVTLPSGSVFIVGGVRCCPRGYQWWREAEIFRHSTQVWRKAKGRTTNAQGTAVLMPNGQVLVAGGSHGIQGGMRNVAETELYDPSTGGWTDAGSMSVDRALLTMTLLPNGQVLVAGGYRGGWGDCNHLSSAELYEPGIGWQLTGAMATARVYHHAVLLPNGEVLVVGGGDCSGNVFASAELYEP